MEYGPALPPVTMSGTERTPQELIIGALTGSMRHHKMQMAPSDKIADITPGIHKEEPASPSAICNYTKAL